MTNRVWEVVQFIKHIFPKPIQTFNVPNICGDIMEEIYCNNGVRILWCQDWDYIEVFGLDGKEYQELMKAGCCYEL